MNEFIFDLEDTSLVGIYVTSDQYTSARGLSVSQSLDQLIKLYGKANRRFKSNGYDLYEYTCSDCYFQAYIDPTEDRIVKIGISKISEVTVREGAEKVRELKKKSYRLREK